MRLLKESASGLLYLHSVGIIHRDVKPGNILVGCITHNAKIADYGISRIADLASTMTARGTLVYQAPEISLGERYGFEADVYSLAITMYEVFKRDMPFTEYERKRGVQLAMDVADRDHRPPLHDAWDPAISALLTSCWVGKPELRASLSWVISAIQLILTQRPGVLDRQELAQKAARKRKSKAELWRCVETTQDMVALGKTLGEGAFATVRFDREKNGLVL